MQRTRRTILILGPAVALLAAAGCTDDRVLADDGESSGTMPSTGSSTVGSPTSGPVDPSPSTGSTTLGADDTTSDDPSSAGFVAPDPDVGGFQECDIWTQDCPPGHKCMPWIEEEGGSGWNSTRCSPIADDPAAPGEPCRYEGWGGSGIDDCELGAMCWDVNPRTLEGICRSICLGTFEAYYCEDPWEACYQGGDGLITLCLPTCDPLAQNCPPGEMCVPVQDDWTCARDDSGEQGAYGDACEFINVCDPGLVCLDSSVVPPGQPCEIAAGCCTEICDLTDPRGDQQCTGAAEGQICRAWYDPGEGPAVLDHVGVCALPQ